jgi:cell division protein FtsQ
VSATLTPDAPAEPAREPRFNGRTKLFIALGGVIVVLALLIWLVAFSPVFGARTVQIDGLNTLTKAAVLKAAAVEHGRPLMRLDTGAIEKRVAAIPDVDSVSVSTSWPSTVRITIHERTPVAYMQRGEGFTLIDAGGKAYRTRATAPTTLPLLVLPTGNASETSATYGAAARVATALPVALRTKVASVQALTADSITLLMDDQRVVRWGGDDRDAEKARVLAVLLTQQNSQIDVTDPDVPFSR